MNPAWFLLPVGAVWLVGLVHAVLHPGPSDLVEDWGPEPVVESVPWHWMNWGLLAVFLALGALFEYLFPDDVGDG